MHAGKGGFCTTTTRPSTAGACASEEPSAPTQSSDSWCLRCVRRRGAAALGRPPRLPPQRRGPGAILGAAPGPRSAASRSGWGGPGAYFAVGDAEEAQLLQADGAVGLQPVGRPLVLLGLVHVPGLHHFYLFFFLWQREPPRGRAGLGGSGALRPAPGRAQ